MSFSVSRYMNNNAGERNMSSRVLSLDHPTCWFMVQIIALLTLSMLDLRLLYSSSERDISVDKVIIYNIIRKVMFSFIIRRDWDPKILWCTTVLPCTFSIKSEKNKEKKTFSLMGDLFLTFSQTNNTPF